ncbi:hypothetical protein [Phenylobacterium sp.]|uniref:hypothetical protein n=1 Tax=Phenylobacterium sp. TaxID=1871053 RepID=UPI00272FA2F7|nr:hypothetical protein [Phenylobacterium sp.]MDP1873685.1 hypothetical protein [Phenylobacterium sp.]
MDKLIFEPHNGYGSTIDGEPLPFGYLSKATPVPQPVFELSPVTGGSVEELTAYALAAASAPALLEALKAIVEEFGGTIEQYHKIGPDYTLSAGTEVFEVSTILDREPLIEAARAAIFQAEGGE